MGYICLECRIEQHTKEESIGKASCSVAQFEYIYNIIYKEISITNMVVGIISHDCWREKNEIENILI